MIRILSLALALAVGAESAVAGPADTAPKRFAPRPSAAEIARAQFCDDDKVQRSAPPAPKGRVVISTHGPQL
jgi:hypothetical protein